MAEPRKPKSPLQRMPTRQLVAGIKRDLRKMIRELPKQKPRKSKNDRE
jgi:hypothetical protein